MLKKLLIGIIISVFAIGFLAYKINLNEFYNIKDRISYIYLIPFAFGGFAGWALFGIRWYIFLEKKIVFKHALASVILGGGANMVLPARGGDILRLYYCKSESQIQYPTLLSKVFIEKVIDFIAVILIGLVSFLLLGINNAGAGNFAIFTFSGFLIFSIITGLVLIRYKNHLVIQLLSIPFKIIKKELFFNTKIKEHIIELGEFLTVKTFLKPVIITTIMWLIPYSLAYFGISGLLGIEITYIEILFLMFCGAMGVAVPSAPSGIGVFHASIISGFVLLGKQSSLGLVYATTFHLAQFIIFSFFSLLVYMYWTWRRRHPKVI